MSKKVNLGLVLLGALLMSMLFDANGVYAKRDVRLPEVTGKIITERTNDWESLIYNNQYVLQNNTWNRQATSKPYKQSIFTEKLEDGTTAVGWRWNWPYISSGVLAYPEIIYGTKPWDESLTTKNLTSKMPIQAGSKKITVDFDITLNAVGNYNMAFEIWVVSKLPNVSKNISHEIMIWNVKNGFPPAGTKRDSLTVDGIGYDLYVKEGHKDDAGNHINSWDYLAFVAEKNILQGPLQLSSFIDYLLDKGYFTKDHYLTSVELGNEIQGGTGCVEIKDYNVEIE